MTREEAMRIAIGLRTDFKCKSDTMVDFCNTVIKALEQEPCDDLIRRQAVIQYLNNEYHGMISDESMKIYEIIEMLNNQPSVTPTGHWIPVSERLPEELETVNITWVNHNPPSYYADIKDKTFTATGVYFNGQWYWWSTLCADMLAEYSHNHDDIIDDDIEIIAWMPLPEPYKGESEE